MRLVYELYVRHEVYESLSIIRGSNRQRVLNFIEYRPRIRLTKATSAHDTERVWTAR